jgi:nitrilase
MREVIQVFAAQAQKVFKVAAIQAGPVLGNAPDWFDVPATLQKAVSLIDEASRNGARLVVFPETWLPCYPYWGYDYSAGPLYRDLRNSIVVPSRETEALCEAARRTNTYVVMGMSERDARYHGRMYNSILYIGPDGSVLGVHRKICNTHMERLFHTMGDGGDNLKTVFETELGYLGGSICGEHSQLALMYNWIMLGVQVHCSLWPGLISTRNESDICTRSFCWAAHSFGVMSATYFPEESLPRDFYKNSHFNVPGAFCGGSGIVGPLGTYIAEPIYDQEAIIYGDIDLLEADKARFAVNLTGAYSRWDIIGLRTRDGEYEPIAEMRAGCGPECVPRPGPTETAEADRIRQLEARVQHLERLVDSLYVHGPAGRRE